VFGRTLKGAQQPRVKLFNLVIGLDEENVLFALCNRSSIKVGYSQAFVGCGQGKKFNLGKWEYFDYEG
jgi:hypothetical protein